MTPKRDCNRYIGDANTADGFFGFNCGTFLGGFSSGCRDAQQQAQAMRDQCERQFYEDALNRENQQRLIEFAKWTLIVGAITLGIIWFLKD